MENTFSKHLLKPLNNSRGAAAVMVAITMVVLLAMGAAAIDIGHALVARNELQNVADAGALAGTRALGLIYEGLPQSAQATYLLSGGAASTIVTAVQSTAVLNEAAGVNIAVAPADIQIGTWNSATRTLTPTTAQPNAVRVTTRRDATVNGRISTFLASIVGMSSLSVGAVATAELTPVGATGPGVLNLPIAISELFFTQYGCGDSIMLYPSNGNPQSCAGFTTFNQSPSNDITERNIINGLAAGTYTSPATTAGTTQLQFTNGTLSNPTWNALVNLFNVMKNADGTADNMWDTFVPVYQGNACNPSGAIPIVGYARIRITNVHGQPGATVTGNVECPNYVAGTTGGGPAYGVSTTLPGLVE